MRIVGHSITVEFPGKMTGLSKVYDDFISDGGTDDDFHFEYLYGDSFIPVIAEYFMLDSTDHTYSSKEVSRWEFRKGTYQRLEYICDIPSENKRILFNGIVELYSPRDYLNLLMLSDFLDCDILKLDAEIILRDAFCDISIRELSEIFPDFDIPDIVENQRILDFIEETGLSEKSVIVRV